MILVFWFDGGYLIYIYDEVVGEIGEIGVIYDNDEWEICIEVFYIVIGLFEGVIGFIYVEWELEVVGEVVELIVLLDC